MSIIEEIKTARKAQLTEEQKRKLLEGVKAQLVSNPYALIEGAEHYRAEDNRWRFPQDWRKSCNYTGCLQAPFKMHTAISEYLSSLGFYCRRWYNGGGVDQGLEVRI